METGIEMFVWHLTGFLPMDHDEKVSRPVSEFVAARITQHCDTIS